MKTIGSTTFHAPLPSALISGSPVDIFIENFYKILFDELDTSITTIRPHINFDTITPKVDILLSRLSEQNISELRRLGVNGESITTAEWRKKPAQKALMILLSKYSQLTDCLLNIHPLASITIKAYEITHNNKVTTSNFVNAKQWIDSINRIRWSRQQTTSEQQSGVSNLGSVSELLLEKAFSSKLDNQNFFKTENQKIKSYGDFVLMCLPNNLWISVKSNFARERLLASGYTTDILGVGFFTDKDEFTSRSKIRNFQRVGFLAMYLPFIPISEEQVANNKNTFDEVIGYYSTGGRTIPLNINGTPFIRSLANIESDISSLLSETRIANRTTLDF